ncbi:hypothetical protein Tco_0937905 [Tanacetum coccineum]|uniref:Uncharacterized protein n=1 Tax=Tanacetum coccineum TaxID=301880 RepID=A0ABQ5DFL3_9ASTR
MLKPKPVKKLSKKDQLMLDEELAFKLQAKEEEEEKRLAREKAQKIEEVNIAWDDVQAKQRRKHFTAKRAEEKRNGPPTRAQQRIFMTELVVESSKKDEAEIAQESNSKRAGTELEQKSIKKQKVDEDNETTELQRLIEVVPDKEEVAIDAIPLATKHPSIGDLNTMFDPHVEDQVWRNQQDYRVLDWKIYDSCGVHSLRMQHMHIHMLVEKRYPLTPAIITDMLNKKLQCDHFSEMLSMKKLEILKKNIKFRGGLLGLKDFMMILKLLLLRITISEIGYSSGDVFIKRIVAKVSGDKLLVNGVVQNKECSLEPLAYGMKLMVTSLTSFFCSWRNGDFCLDRKQSCLHVASFTVSDLRQSGDVNTKVEEEKFMNECKKSSPEEEKDRAFRKVQGGDQRLINEQGDIKNKDILGDKEYDLESNFEQLDQKSEEEIMRLINEQGDIKKEDISGDKEVRNMSKLPTLPTVDSTSMLIKLGVVLGLGFFVAGHSLYNVEGGHHDAIKSDLVEMTIQKMQKYILKQQFEGFSVSNTEVLHKFMTGTKSSRVSLEIHGAGVST